MASSANEWKSKDLLGAQLRATLDVIPAYTWYANPSGALTFVNQRCADYLGLPKDHPLRFGIDMGAGGMLSSLFFTRMTRKSLVGFGQPVCVQVRREK